LLDVNYTCEVNYLTIFRMYIHQIQPTHILLTLNLITTCYFIGKQIQIQTFKKTNKDM